MQRYDPIQDNFNAGALTPLLSGAEGLERYRWGAERQENFLSAVQGPLVRRPGLRYINFTKDNSRPARLLDFQFSQTQTYGLEFGNNYVRFYKGQVLVLDQTGQPYELVSPYGTAELGDIYSWESADIIYLAHPAHPVMMLMRYGDTDWQLQPAPFEDGPYLDENITATTLTPSGTSGLINLAAAPAPEEMVINGDFSLKGLTSYGGGVMADWGYSQSIPGSWLLANGQAQKTPGDTEVLSQKLRNLKSGESYTVKITVTGVFAGSLTPRLGGTPGTPLGATGSITGSIGASQTALLPSTLLGLEVGLGLGIAGVTGVKVIRALPASLASTEVNQDSAVGQAVLFVAATTNFLAGQTIIIGWGTASEEVAVIACVQDGVSLTLTANLMYAHAGVEAAPVQAAVVLDSAADATVSGAAIIIGGAGTTSQTIVAGTGSLLELVPSADFDGGVRKASTQIVPSKSGLPFFDPGHVGSFWSLYYYLAPPVSQNLHAYNVGDFAFTGYQLPGYSPEDVVLKCVQAGITGDTPINITVMKAGDRYSDGTVIWQLMNDPSTSGSSTYAWTPVKILAYIDAWNVQAQVIGQLGQAISTISWREGAWSDYRGWPRCGTFHDGRLYLGSTSNQPQTIWGSTVADFYNFAVQADVTDDGPVTLTLDSDQMNPLYWLMSARTLLAGSAGGIWRIYGSNSEMGQITPSSTVARQDIGNGCSPMKPVRCDNVLLYVENHGQPGNPGRKVRELAYSYEVDSYEAQDLTVFNEHLTAPGLAWIALQRSPQRILWAGRVDGRLLSMSYERNQKVYGWAEHPTKGRVESGMVIPGAYQDELWLEVQRYGEIGRTVEMLERHNWQEVSVPRDVADAFFVDCGCTYNGAATDLVPGLTHLAGQQVDVLADGKPHRPLQVDAQGRISLDYPARKVQAGLHLTAYWRSLRQAARDRYGMSMGKIKAIAEVSLRLVDSWGGRVGPDQLHLEDIFKPGQIDRSDPQWRARTPRLCNGDVLVDFRDKFDPAAQYEIWQDVPLPLTVAAAAPRLELLEP